MANWTEYCGDTLWDEQVVWNTTNPRVTLCFQRTVFALIPPLYLILSLPILIYAIIKSTAKFEWNIYNRVRQAIALALVVVSLAELIIVVQDHYTQPSYFSGPYSDADLVNASVRFVFSLLLCLLFYLLVRRAIHTSGIIWTYLGLSTVCLLLQLVFTLLDRAFKSRSDTVLVINCLLTLALFIQSFVSDSKHFQFKKKEENKICPKTTASFVSRLTYSWYSSLTYIGWRRPIVMEDVWQARPVDSAIYNYERFQEKLDALRAKHLKSNPSTLFQVSILRVIWNSTWYYFLSGAFFKLFNDAFTFLNPMIMKKLINFVSDTHEHTWHGYIYALCLFLVTTGQIVALNYYFNRMMIFGIRVRTQLTGAIYRKSLKLANSARSQFTVGQIVNLMAVDAQRFVDLSAFVNLLWSAPLQILVALWLLWNELGVAVLGGFFFMLLLIPVNGYLTSAAKKLQTKQMKLKDDRVRAMNEILSGIKIIKLYGWEEAFIEKVQALRAKELRFLKRINYLFCGLQALWTLAPFLVSFITFAIYVLIDSEHVLTAQKAFVSLSLFNILRFPMTMLPTLVTLIIMASVSVKRLNNFLTSKELTNYVSRTDENPQNCITLDKCTFSWFSEEESLSTANGKSNKKKKKSKEPEATQVDHKPSLHNINIKIEKSSFVAIVGNVGSGKSSLMNAILGNMELVEGKINITKSMKIAYTPQEAWIQNSTLRDNIIFGLPFKEDYYQRVVNACSLTPDFAVLPGGDLTEIGEKGINLSGGQKQRVSLARACYCDSDIYLLDDPLAAVDSHVGKHIFEHILHSQTGLLRNKTRVLVTNNLSVLPFTDKIYVIKNGHIIETGTYKDLIAQNNYFASLIQLYSGNENNETGGEDEKLSEEEPEKALNFKTSKLVEKEDVQTGRVKLRVYLRYMQAISLVWCVMIAINYVLAQTSNAGSSVWLSKWSKEKGLTRDETIFHLLIYGAIGCTQGIFTSIGWYALTRGILSAARLLHNRMLYTILRSSMAFFDVTPLGRILNRFSKDIDVCDSTIQGNIRVMLVCLFSVLATLAIISIELPIFLVIVLPVVIGFYFIQRLYISTARQLKRLESITKSPVYSHFSETLSGVSTIRAYSVCDQFIERSDHHVDVNNSCYFASVISNRWLSIRLEMTANLIVLFSAIFAVIYRDKMDPSSVGLVISYALSTTQNLNYFVRSTTDIETNIVGVERILEYTDLSTEAEWRIEQHAPPSNWPSRGAVEFVNYCTRYRPGLDLVLKSINAVIEPGEKIGIVGRTGAGKSSLTLALFRLIEPASGCIKIDGVDITKLGLHQVRQRLTIIPQDPVLFSGTIRTNLDPFESFTDNELWHCLELAHLKNFVTTLNSGLDYEITEGGSNLSIGQRQLICLARALLRKTKILVLDEATAAVDMETDSLIQRTIKHAFSDCTILTIAHRLHTIIDSSRVLVLDHGKIAEFDSPENLLADPDSIFYSLAEASGLLNYNNNHNN